MSRLLVGHIPAEYLPDEDVFKSGLDVKLDVWDDGTHEVAVRPGLGDRRSRWSAPFPLFAESADIHEEI